MKEVDVRIEGRQDGRHDGTFRISSFCQAGECLAVAMQLDGSVKVRDTKNARKQPLLFTRDEWAAFVKGVKRGEFDVR